MSSVCSLLARQLLVPTPMRIRRDHWHIPPRELTNWTHWMAPAALAWLVCGCGSGGGSDAPGGSDPSDDADAATADSGSASIPPDPSECPDTPSPSGMTFVINELMVENVYTKLDSFGGRSDWIELHNYGDEELSLCGVGVTDDLDEPSAAYLGANATIPAGGYLLVWLSGRDDRANHHLPIDLAMAGGEVGMRHPDGTIVAQLRYGDQSTDFSAARTPDGSSEWTIEWHPSPGDSNSSGTGAPIRPHEHGASLEQVPETGDLTETILGYDEIPNIGIQLAPEEIAKLASDPRSWVPGNLVYDGREYGPVGIKLKGQNSFQSIHDKPSFRINIDEYVDHARFFDLDDLTLNNMDDDYSMMHERLGYLVARQVGPASRANHAVVTLNGQNYGLYANVETVKHHLIARWFNDSSGPLFEASDVDFIASDVAEYELESGPEDRSKLSALATALTNPNADAAIAAAEAHVDLDGFISFWAMEAVIGQFDAFPYSTPGDDYFVYVDPTSGKLWFLPWGMDETFYSGDIDVTSVSSALATRCMQSTSCRQSFVDRVWEVLDTVEGMNLDGERAQVAQQIAPHVAADSRKPYSNATVAEYQQQLSWFLQNRRDNLESALGPSP